MACGCEEIGGFLRRDEVDNADDEWMERLALNVLGEGVVLRQEVRFGVAHKARVGPRSVYSSSPCSSRTASHRGRTWRWH